MGLPIPRTLASTSSIIDCPVGSQRVLTSLAKRLRNPWLRQAQSQIALWAASGLSVPLLLLA